MNRVKTWFNQPARKQRRRNNRIQKAKAIFPRPVAGALRPVVHPASIRYNFKVRVGRGFTLEELKEAGINVNQARTIGISVDSRRKNRSERTLRSNVQRLKEYKSKLILFPLREKKPRKGDSSKEETSKASQLTGEVLPLVPQGRSSETIDAKDFDSKFSAFTTLKVARSDARLIGVREVRKKKKADEAALAAAKKPSAE